MIYLLLACRVLIGAVFVLSVIGKVRTGSAFRAFVSSVEDLRVARRDLAGPLAVTVVGAEIAVVVLLAVAPADGFGLAALLFVAFSAGILAAVRKGVRAPCRCFGASATPLGVPHVVRNVALLTAAVTGGIIAIGSPAGTPHPIGIALSLLSATIVLVPLALFFDDFVALLSAPAAAQSPPPNS